MYKLTAMFIIACLGAFDGAKQYYQYICALNVTIARTH